MKFLLLMSVNQVIVRFINMNKFAKMIVGVCFIMMFVLASSFAEDKKSPNAVGDGHKKVLLKDVDVLLLETGKKTTGRRSVPVNQLECVNFCNNKPKKVACRNIGHDGSDVIWDCKSDPPGKIFDVIDVQCEGYEYPDDEYVLAGSCGLRYNGASHFQRAKPLNDTGRSPTKNNHSDIAFVIVSMIAFMYICSCMEPDSSHSHPYRRTSSYTSYSPHRSSSSSDFWSGAAAGFIAGSSGGGSSYGSSGCSWGGGGGRSSWGGGGSSFVRTTRR